MKGQSTKTMRSACWLASILTAVSLSVVSFAQTEKVIYELPFPGVYIANLISDAAGNLYGTDTVTEVIFELSPPAQAGGSWTRTVLYAFQGTPDGLNPSSLVMDKSGNLFGTTSYGGIVGKNCGVSGCGTVFELSPPAQQGGAWTETILYKFPNASAPVGLTIGPNGSLFGAAPGVGHGLIFQLRPPSQSGGAWKASILYQFQGGTDGANPFGSFLIDRNLNLYGTSLGGNSPPDICDLGCGTVFELSPPTAPLGSWTKTTLFSFQGSPIDGYIPRPGLIMDNTGNLYGVTYWGGAACGGQIGCGTVYRLTPPAIPGGAWTETILHSFGPVPDGAYPLALTADSTGKLYGPTNIGGALNTSGTVFELTPPAQPGGTWTETILHSFGGLSDGISPTSNLVYKFGVLFGATLQGGTGCSTGCGVIFGVRP